MANQSLGLVTDQGVLYQYAADGSSGLNSTLWRLRASDGTGYGTQPWLASTLPVWVTPSTMSFNTQIAIGKDKIGIVGLNASNDLILTIITKATGAVTSSTTIVNGANKGASDIAADTGDNFYVAWANTANTPNRISKYDSTGANVWTKTAHTRVYSVYYDRTNSRLLIAGQGIDGGANSVAILAVSDGSTSSSGDPSSAGSWLSIRGDGRGTYIIGRANTVAKISSAFAVSWTNTVTGFSGYQLAVNDGQQTTYAAQAGTRVWRSIAVLDGDVVGFDTVGAMPVTSGTAALSAIPPVVFASQNGRYVYFATGYDWMKYDPVTNAMLPWTATAGSLPSDSGNLPRLICTWRGRTVLSGILSDPQNWFMSRVNAPTDFDYGSSVSQAMAVAGNQTNSVTGMPSDIINCLLPYNDDILLIGGDHSIWRLTGDPMAGGQLDIVTDTVGMAWGRPYCRDPLGNIYFFSSRGPIYKMEPNGKPVRISQKVDQEELEITTMRTNIFRMAWDDREQGFHAFVTPLDKTATTKHYWYDARNDSWWRDSFVNTNHNAKVLYLYDGDDPDDRVVLLGCWDGYIRAFQITADDDDGYAILSKVLIGPIHLKNRIPFLVTDLQASLASESGTLSWAVQVGNNEEAAKSAAPLFTGTFKSGRNRSQALRAFGHAAYLKLSNSTKDLRWSLESILAVLQARTPERRRNL